MPDFEKTKPPTYRPPEGSTGVEAIGGDDPFIMQGDGKAWLFAPVGLLDGPLPTHYEPAESPVRNPLYAQQGNPTRMVYERAENVTNPSPPEQHADVFPYVFTTSRLTEHHTAGAMSRNLEYLSELQPAMFIEVSPELAAELGIEHLGWAHVVTARSAVEGAGPGHRPADPVAGGREGAAPGVAALPLGQGGLTTGDSANDLVGINLDPNVLIQESKVGTCDVRAGRRPTGPALVEYVEEYRRRAGVAEGHDIPLVTAVGATQPARRRSTMTPPRKGFFTDTSVCIGCKACEVACKEWNLLPQDGMDLLGMSYDNTGSLGANTWRHVAFIEQPVPAGRPGADEAASGPQFLGMPQATLPGAGRDGPSDMRWLMASDVCKHCTDAACLDVCPTGSLFRTEFGTVVVQQDICNGCGYCVSACPYGVIDRREGDGRAWKCTLCYDRLKGDLQPACATACPTQSIQFGDLDELRERAAGRLDGCWSPVSPRPGSTATTSTTGSAATARSSCCSTSRRCTGCRPTRS